MVDRGRREGVDTNKLRILPIDVQEIMRTMRVRPARRDTVAARAAIPIKLGGGVVDYRGGLGGENHVDYEVCEIPTEKGNTHERSI